MIRFMKLFTELELTEIEEMEGQLATETGPTYVNSLKRRLADECTTLLHGADCLPAIHETADSLFKNKGGNLADLPRVEVAEDSISVVDALIAAEFAKSKGEARRLIKGGRAARHGVKVEDVERRWRWPGPRCLLVGEEEARAARGEVRGGLSASRVLVLRRRDDASGSGFFLFFALDLAALLQPLPARKGEMVSPQFVAETLVALERLGAQPTLNIFDGTISRPAGCPRSPPLVRRGSRHRRHSRARRAWRCAGAARRSTRRARTAPRRRSGRGPRSSTIRRPWRTTRCTTFSCRTASASTRPKIERCGWRTSARARDSRSSSIGLTSRTSPQRSWKGP